jgi:hypothetical protein
MPRSFDLDTLARLVALLQRPRTFAALQGRLGVDRATMYRWLGRVDVAGRRAGQELVVRGSRHGSGSLQYQLVLTEVLDFVDEKS